MKSNISIILCLCLSHATAQWQFLPTEILADWRSVHFINDSVGFIVGNLNENSYVMKTEDYGSSWEIVMHETTTYYYDIHFPTPEIGFVSTYHNLLKSTDSGDTWVYPNPEANLFSYWGILFLDEYLGLGCFADGGAVMAKTIDGGLSWDEDETIGAKQIIEYGDCSIRAISNQLFMKSENCGDSWQTTFMNIDDNRTFPSLDNSSVGVLACGIGSNGQIYNFNYGTIAFCSDDGQTWNIQDFPHAWQYHSIFFPTDQLGYCVGEAFETFPDVILKTEDGGITWHYQEYDLLPNGQNPNFLDVYCPSDTVGYAVGYFGEFYRTLNGGGPLLQGAYSVGVSEYTKDKFQIYPNPTSNTITIQGMASGERFETRILDLSGRTISRSNNESQINVNSMESGFYFLEVIVGYRTSVMAWVKE